MAQQLREAMPSGVPPRFLLHDNDRGIGDLFARVAVAGRVEVLRPLIRAPRANAICERFLGSVRRKCFNHHPNLPEGQLRRTLRAYCAYFNGARLHQGLGHALPDAAEPVSVTRLATPIVSLPFLGDLYHDYRHAA